SGVGKTSLLNAIEPGLKLRVGAISEKWRTGKHTTTAAELVPLALGGYMVDTPGLREAGTWNLDPDALGVCFPEFRPDLHQCLVQVDPLGVREADHHEQDVRQLQGEGSFGFRGFFRLRTETVIDFPRQLAHLCGEPLEDGERGEVAFLLLADPAIDRLLGV